MGDMNTQAVELLEHSPLRDLGLVAPQIAATFPSWQPATLPGPHPAQPAA